MTLRTYQAPTMAEALAEVKRDLGRDAVILQTRTVRKGRFWRPWGRSLWEVTASPNVNVPQRIGKGSYVSQTPPEDVGPVAAPVEEKARLVTPAARPALSAEGPASGRPGFLTNQVADIRRMVETLLSHSGGGIGQDPDVPAELREFHTQLVSQDVHGQGASEFIRELCMNLTGQQLSDPELIRRELHKLLASRIRTAGEEAAAASAPADRPRVIALIGPTGVGKTTTIAKLAANYKLRGGKKVGLITIDTYRIAAVDQLRTYADIIEVPIKAVLTAGELNEAISAMRDRDVVLIDTAGRSQNNCLRLSQLRSFISAAQPDEVHLVVSATANQTCTRRILDRFLPLGANRLIVTKLDEAETFGVFLNVSSATGRPISYVTTGQNVPDDMSRADASRLADHILSGRFGDEADAN